MTKKTLKEAAQNMNDCPFDLAPAAEEELALDTENFGLGDFDLGDVTTPGHHTIILRDVQFVPRKVDRKGYEKKPHYELEFDVLDQGTRETFRLYAGKALEYWTKAIRFATKGNSGGLKTLNEIFDLLKTWKLDVWFDYNEYGIQFSWYEPKKN